MSAYPFLAVVGTGFIGLAVTVLAMIIVARFMM